MMIAQFIFRPLACLFSEPSRVELILGGAECLVSTRYCLRSDAYARYMETSLLNGLSQNHPIPNPTALNVERRGTGCSLTNGINHL